MSNLQIKKQVLQFAGRKIYNHDNSIIVIQVATVIVIQILVQHDNSSLVSNAAPGIQHATKITDWVSAPDLMYGFILLLISLLHKQGIHIINLWIQQTPQAWHPNKEPCNENCTVTKHNFTLHDTPKNFKLKYIHLKEDAKWENLIHCTPNSPIVGRVHHWIVY